MSYFKDIGFKIFIFDNFKLYSLSFLCRWVCFELCVDFFKFVGKEILISDVFEYIIFIVYVNGEVDFEVFFYDYFDLYEIIQIKFNVGNIEDFLVIVEGLIMYNEVML